MGDVASCRGLKRRLIPTGRAGPAGHRHQRTTRRWSIRRLSVFWLGDDHRVLQWGHGSQSVSNPASVLVRFWTVGGHRA
jgi:hypothetical protein